MSSYKEEPMNETGNMSNEKPKKYFTLSFDDGITQDLKIMEILKRNNVYCCTFNINTGLCGANWDWVGKSFDRPDVTHIRFTEKELESGIYDGFDVAVHTLHHPSLKIYDSDIPALVNEICGDSENIRNLTGISPTGMAWPGGDTEYTDTTVSLVYSHTGMRFARGTTSTYSFGLPEYFLKWMPTCSICDDRCIELAKGFIDARADKDMLFYVWGHGYELDIFNLYDRLESIVEMMRDSDVSMVTNSEFYNVFKDKIPSWKQ